MINFLYRYNIWGKLLLVASSIGFLYQVSEVSKQYFKYETDTLFILISEEYMYFFPSNINSCPRFVDILDRDRVYNETRIMIPRVHDDNESYAVEGLLTMEQILEYTPDNETVIASCRLREVYNSISILSGKECMKRLTVIEFFMQEYICYLIMLRNRTKHRKFDITTSTVGHYEINVFYR